VDDQGLNVSLGERLEPRPRIVLVSPSRQYPLGMTLSPDRRTELLELSQRSNSWIVEDDYDSEYRYKGRPLPALQSMDLGQRVIYLGTFSKALLPTFRLGYLVVPESLSTSFRTAKAIIDRHAPLLEQIALHEFMERGYFAGHLRKMRALYAERQKALITELRSNLAGFLEVEEADSGMHITAFLPSGVNDVVFCQVLLDRGVIARPLSPYYANEAKRNGLILGFPAVPPAQLHIGVMRLVQVAREFGMRDATSV
jgi:GntR family transcriptional regulator / MocR family aminotransferase